MGGAVLVPIAVVQYSRHHCTVRATRAGVRDATSNPTGCGYFLCLCAGRGVARALPVSSVDEPTARLIRWARLGRWTDPGAGQPRSAVMSGKIRRAGAQRSGSRDSREPGDDPALPRVCAEVVHVIGRRAGMAAIPRLPGYPQGMAARRAQLADRHVKIAAGARGVALGDVLTLAGHSIAGTLATAWRRGRDGLNGHSVHKSVDDLCKTASSLCAKPEKLGILAPSYSQGKSAAWINAIHTLCKGRKRNLSTRHAEKVWDEPNIYHKFI
jgi:hypothetical protein